MPSYFDLTKPAPVLSFLPYISFNAETGVWHDNTSTTDGNGGWISRKQELLAGFVFCPDFGSAEHGPLAFTKPPQFQYLRLFGQPEMDTTGLPSEFRPGVRLKVIVAGLGLREFSSNAEAVCREIRYLWDAFVRSPEAMAGKLPRCKSLPPRSYWSAKQSKTYHAPVFEMPPDKYIERHALFGPRPVPPPKPVETQPQLDIDRIHRERLASDIHYDNAAATKSLPQKTEPAPTPAQVSQPQRDDDLNDVIPF